MINNLRKSINSPMNLFKELLKIQRKEIDKKNKKLKYIIVALQNQYHIDFCNYAYEIMQEGFSCFDVYYVLTDAIPILTNNSNSLLKYIKEINTKMRTDMVSGSQYLTIENLTKKQPDFAKDFLNDLILLGEPFTTNYIVTILKNLKFDTKAELYSEITKLLYNENGNLIDSAIMALGNIPYDKNEDKKIIEKTFDILDKFSNENYTEHFHAVAISLTNLYYLGEVSILRLIALSKTHDPNALYTISCFLLSDFSKKCQQEWFEEILLNLSFTKCKYNGILRNIDLLFYELLMYHPDKFSLIERFITEWLINSDFTENNMNFQEIFESSVNNICKNNAFYETLICNFFNHDNYKVNIAAKDLVDYLQQNKKISPKLKKTLIQHFCIEDIVYTSRKILGYIYNVDSLCSLIFSILTAKPKDDHVRDLIHYIFENYIAIDYPYQTIEFLKKEFNSGNFADDFILQNTPLTERIESKYNEKQKLPQLNELIIPEKYKYLVMTAKKVDTNKIIKQSRKKSIFADLFKSIPLKYGNGWFCYHEGEYIEHGNLKPIPFEMYLPNTEIFYPVTATRKRFSFRSAKRGEK